MIKKLYKNEAERLYIEEQMTIEEIALKLNISIRTINYWKKDNGWNEKKKSFIKSKQESNLRTYFFAKRMLAKITEDMKNGRKISSGRLYSLIRMLDAITE